MLGSINVRRGSHYGFTLVEMAVVLFILGLLIAGLLGPLETQLEARDRRQTLDTMEVILDALYGYAITNRRLPCPNTDGDGVEQLDTDINGTDDYDAFTGPALDAIVASGGDCINEEGFVPWVTLGVKQGDAWGNRFTYRVAARDYTTVDVDGICDGNVAPFELDLCSVGDVDVQTRGDDPLTGGIAGKVILAQVNNVPAVVLSHGRNGFGATTVGGLARPAPPAGTDELENTNLDETFMSRSYTGDNQTCDEADESQTFCPFDDMVKWLSPPVLNNRLVTAGQLP